MQHEELPKAYGGATADLGSESQMVGMSWVSYFQKPS